MTAAPHAEHVMEREGVEPHETIMVGVAREDFVTASSAGLLFLNAGWDRQDVEYGFKMATPREIIRFIDLFGLKEHHWFYSIDEPPIRYRSLGPYSTARGVARVLRGSGCCGKARIR